MVTWQGSVPRPWPDPRRRPSMSAAPAAREQDRKAGGTSLGASDERDQADLDQAEAALAPALAGGDHDSVARLLGDQRVVQAILDEGLHGPRHQALEDMLIRYAVPVLRKLLADGRLVSRAIRLGRPAGSLGTLAELTEADREELVRDMVADALPVFTRAVFEDRHWTGARQASLKTYFVNACILQFAQLHRQWLDQRRAVQPAGLELDVASTRPVLDPAVTVALRDEVDRLLAGITDPQLREVLVLRGAGYTAEDAARQAGLTPKAAEGRLARLRQNLKGARRGADPSGSTRQDTNAEGRRAQ
jgi:DNA-directed RNA polymerase specialized sigma24 family protein